MGHFLAELKRRNIYRVAVAYTVVAWLLLQVVNNVAPVMDLPPWIARAILLLLVIGFPIALVFAWIHQLAPVPATGTPAQTPAGKQERVASVKQGILARLSGTADQARGEHAFASPEPPAPISIAVLPFANMSGDAGQEYFSDGMTEEITAALVKVADLRVVARTSAFEFKGRSHNIRSMGAALGASYLIEGSVRKSGDRVRITAQLIKAQDGTHLWAEKYDRELIDVFAVQEEIAQAIAGALRMPLGLKVGEALVPSRVGDLESYQLYLRARALVRARGKSITQAIDILEPFVAHNPTFAPAWALLAHAYFLFPTYNSPISRSGTLEEACQFIRTFIVKGETAARRAIQLDSKNAGGYVALAALQTQRGKWVEGETLLRKALALDPVEPEALYSLSVNLASTARFNEAVAIGQTLQMLEPLVPNYTITVAGYMLMSGQIQAAITSLESIPADAAGGYFRSITLAQAYAAAGRFDDAATALLAMPQPNVVSRQSVEDAARLIRTAPAKVLSPRDLPNLEGGLNFVYGYIGAEERVIEFAERVRAVMEGTGTTTFIWTPAYALARKTEQFKAHLRAVGLVDYWRTHAWPEQCHPTTGDDFECN